MIHELLHLPLFVLLIGVGPLNQDGVGRLIAGAEGPYVTRVGTIELTASDYERAQEGIDFAIIMDRSPDFHHTGMLDAYKKNSPGGPRLLMTVAKCPDHSGVTTLLQDHSPLISRPVARAHSRIASVSHPTAGRAWQAALKQRDQQLIAQLRSGTV